MRCDLVRINIYRKISIMYQIYNIVIKKKKLSILSMQIINEQYNIFYFLPLYNKIICNGCSIIFIKYV